MVFNSDIFLLVFLPVVFSLFWLLRTANQRYVLLTISGYVFYGYWNWRFCFLLLLSSLISFTVGLLIQRTECPQKRRWLMIGSITLDLCILGFFKYYNFFAESIHGIAPMARLPLIHVVLPIGISFYTFHTISYIADVAARRIKATANVFEYCAYVCLFPQLVAGPIVRFREIEEDLEKIDGPPREDHMTRGLLFFAVGMVKKVIIADSLQPLVDGLIANHAHFSVATAWLAAAGYAFQLYFDFSGYSEMAVGLGSMFGLRIPRNFNAPYQAIGIQDFWRRWHISLSSWLRDYLYIPLGGNRKTEIRTYVNLMITMGLGGLWHGANWTFVVWGLFQGMLLAIERLISPSLDRVPVAVRRATTFCLVLVSWVFFRSENLSMAGHWLAAMAGIGTHSLVSGLSIRLLALVLGCLAAVNLLPDLWDVKFAPRKRVAFAAGFCVVLAYIFMGGRDSVFLYYQF